MFLPQLAGGEAVTIDNCVFDVGNFSQTFIKYVNTREMHVENVKEHHFTSFSQNDKSCQKKPGAGHWAIRYKGWKARVFGGTLGYRGGDK